MKKLYLINALILCFLVPALINAQDHTNFLNGLVSAYSMESTSLFSDEMNLNNGTVTGTTLADGTIGSALYFTGSQGSMAVVPNSQSLDINGTGITLMADIYPTANGQSGFSVIVQKGWDTGANNTYSFSLSSTNNIRWRNFINGYQRDFIGSTSVPLNTWSRVICVWNSGEARIIRINSTIETEGSTYSGTHDIDSTRDLTIGSTDAPAGSGTRSFVGRIDNVMIWNRALTTAEQNTLINGNLGFSDFNDGSQPVSSVWSTNGSTAYYDNGNVAIGRTTVPSEYKLAVDGFVRAREIRVDQNSWPDYVFSEGYKLPSLEDVERHIKAKGHLINLPSAKVIVGSGLELGEMNRLLLEKIEELTLYILQLKKEIDQRQLMIANMSEQSTKE